MTTEQPPKRQFRTAVKSKRSALRRQAARNAQALPRELTVAESIVQKKTGDIILKPKPKNLALSAPAQAALLLLAAHHKTTQAAFVDRLILDRLEQSGLFTKDELAQVQDSLPMLIRNRR